ncbi:hypothetical protein CORC01_07106 [Colletotrichum orchidophilum]|uniref:Amidase domain-containing protein n=1 Tax=Colletotrichum orchidophilum TaxID=1209926 RepID=A0A1G4B8D1_9PEZI|nr:uncharacterized protein CORC01_07106 [Colletotrichum orchidophilum]OHE97691.1 hypothetical protein CORC01_07106 [Colletotrichum orchidophilum]
MAFNVLTSTATELSRLLARREVTAVELTKAYLEQIRKHNKAGAHLNAIISVVPEEQLLETASKLDQERAEGRVRSPYHGIPFVVKDNIWTAASFGLPTTCGAWALKEAKAKNNADVVQAVLNGWLQGVWRLHRLFGGWRTPAGSSSGSAIAAAVGMAPFALGTETEGSVLQPSDRASLYSIKPTIGKISTRGCLPGIKLTDVVGPMTKSPEDLAAFLDILTPIKDVSHVDFLTGAFKDLRIGFLDTKQWLSGPAIETVNAAIDLVEKSGAKVKRNVALVSSEDDKKFNDLISNDLRKGFEEFAEGLDQAPVKTLQELVDFNREHASECLPEGTSDQQYIEDVVKAADLSAEKYQEYTTTLRLNTGAEGLDAVFRENEIDVLNGPPTGRGTSVAILAGYPVGTLPLGYARFNGRAFGLTVIAPTNAEPLILRIMSAWDAIVFKRQPPPKLMSWEADVPEM